ncbi:MAG TPA: hypothetical protein VLM79_38305 [Kofleriaceae bacterium]|nr:hypothetical protein [Kofleriaceae bacterium]
MATSSELAHAFAAAWSASPLERGAAVDDELGNVLAQLCAAAHRELPELEGAIDDCELVAMLASRAPDREVIAYLHRCHVNELALAQAASQGHTDAIEAIEHEHRGVLEAICWRFAGPAQSAADLRQILREKLYVAPPGARAKLAEYSGQGQLASWLRITAVRVFLDLGKRKDRARESPTADGELAMPDPTDLSL